MNDTYMNPGVPDVRGPGRYLWWLVTRQARRVAAGSVLATAWLVGLMLPPYVLSSAIDEGLQQGDRAALLRWSMVLLGVGMLNAWLGIARHRTMTRIRMDAAFRTAQLTVEQVTRLGGGLSRRFTAGEVVTIGLGDVAAISNTLTITGPGVGSVLAYVVVAALLLSVSPLLAAVVLLGVPLLVVLVGPLLGRLQGEEATYRKAQGALTARLVDMVEGLRVLSGLGGKETYAQRYRRDSQALRARGYRVGSVTSWIQALSVGLPGLFLALVTWLAARMAADGTITVGELVAVYGYAAVLVVPVSTFIEGGYALSRGLVSARHVVRLLSAEPSRGAGPGALTGAPPAWSSVGLADPDSGVTLAPGELTALVSARSADGYAVIDRLGRFTASEARWGEHRLEDLPRASVRERILVADNEADLFSGTLREVISGRGDPDEDEVGRALRAAVVNDIVDGLPGGLGAELTDQGRNLSGGQRQRVRLARALLADAEVLLAADPTSSLDAHTEAAVAAGLRTARTGRTTLVTTTSPMLLAGADTIHYLVDGRVAASGSHASLLRQNPGYRALVSRGGDEDDVPPGPATENTGEALR